MDFVLHPWQIYFLILAGWVNRQQQIVIEYLRTENQVLREKLGKKRILLNDARQSWNNIEIRCNTRQTDRNAGNTMVGFTLWRNPA